MRELIEQAEVNKTSQAATGLLGHAPREHFMDGKYHQTDTIARKLDKPEVDVALPLISQPLA